MISPEDRIKELKIKLPNPPNPVANYVPVVQTGNLLFVSGNGPGLKDDKTSVSGKPGFSISEQDAIAASYSVGLNILAQVKKALDGDLNKVKSCVKITGFVNSTDDFKDQPKVINPASETLSAVFGANGKHARAAISSNSLPLSAAVEIDAIFEL